MLSYTHAHVNCLDGWCCYLVAGVTEVFLGAWLQRWGCELDFIFMISLNPPCHPVRTITPTFQMKKQKLSKKQGFARGPMVARGHVPFVLPIHRVQPFWDPPSGLLGEGGCVSSSPGLLFPSLQQCPPPPCGSLAVVQP